LVPFKETRYQFTRFAGFYSDKTWDLMKNMSSSTEGKSKTGGETPVRTNLDETTILIPYLIPVYCLHPDLLKKIHP
jgi:hypothetical protein